MVAALIPGMSLLRHSAALAAHAQGPTTPPVEPPVTHTPKAHPHHTSAGVDRTHLSTLTMLSGQVQHARTNAAHSYGALIGSGVQPDNTTTLFFDDMESGTNGWTTLGDTHISSYYPHGHDFWNLVNTPHTLAVPSFVNPTLVSYPDATGLLPAAHSGQHAWWYGNNAALDAHLSSDTNTYAGNTNDWPFQESAGVATNDPNAASLISPAIDLTTAPNATLTFATWWEIESVNPAHFDMMYLDISQDGGTTWSALGVLNPMQNPAGGSDAYPYTNNGLDAPASWHIVSVNLTPYVGSHVQVRFHFDTVDQYDNGFRGWLIDDVGVYSDDATTTRVSAISPTSGKVGDTITLTGTNFGATQGTSKVTCNNVTASVQSWSNTSIVATVPLGASTGPLVVTVNGLKTPAIGFLVTGTLTLSAPTASYGTPETVTGQGFAAKEVVNVYLYGVTGTLLTSATTDGKGQFTTPTVPLPNMRGGNTLVLASGQTSGTTAGAVLSITPTVSIPTSPVLPGQATTITGQGFAAYEQLSLQFDNPYTTLEDHNLSADSTGSVSGIFAIASNITSGQHTVSLIGQTSGLIAQTSITVAPAFMNYGSTSTPNGGPGTILSITGSGFIPHDTLTFTWDSSTGTTIGRQATVDAFGSVTGTVVIPTNASPGLHTIIASSQHLTTPVSEAFQVNTPLVTVSPNGVQAGTSVSFTLMGFQAGEQVVLTWDVNNGQQLTSVQVTSSGSTPPYTYPTFTVPVGPIGIHVVTATGSSSGIKATTNLTVGPAIALNTLYGLPGSTISVTGSGFSANETLDLYFDRQSNGIVQTTTDTAGAFSISLKTPTGTAGTSTTLYVTNIAGTESANAVYTFTKPSFQSNGTDIYGSFTTFYGSSFWPNEQVNIFWKYGLSTAKQLGSATADNNGAFSVQLMLPGVITTSGSASPVSVTALGVTSNTPIATSVYPSSGITISPSQGPVGTRVTVKGGNFGAETVVISFQNIKVAKATTKNGGFQTSFSIPKTALIGYDTIRAIGSTTGHSVSLPLIVIPTLTISPTSGPAGTVITITGAQFTTANTVLLTFSNPATGTFNIIGTVNVSSTGTISSTYKIPTGLSNGSTYFITAQDNATSITAQATFVAQ